MSLRFETHRSATEPGVPGTVLIRDDRGRTIASLMEAEGAALEDAHEREVRAAFVRGVMYAAATAGNAAENAVRRAAGLPEVAPPSRPPELSPQP